MSSSSSSSPTATASANGGADALPSKASCYNLSYFKEYMKELRRVDDNIMLRINTTNIRSEEACASFFRDLTRAYERRERAVAFCQSQMDGELAVLRKKLEEDPDDYKLKSRIFAEETQRRLITNELVVEDIVRQRTMKVFRDKCRVFQLPATHEDVGRRAQ
ncbi:caffeine-induced death protein 2-domain-containing protein [Thamnocephalis sphaerospora]|uniref:Caffeine-induced death protein 2-domain-containing protein n=1 Tax=Thamnocephalis sphaerospora TaxID=78915 RepID=A0A4P9XVC6_9FUNG|nr:caffeine-induced death protein 2-domain-containing protein [Thamnocephalis sphaerospora]|eukprot:RKP10223.1 caffeine-induced death protein 2-domain-containing protein [Thamnocephalis sphaerospora]